MLALEQWVDRLLPSWPLVATPGAAGEELRQGNEAAEETLDPYSARHGYAHSTHLIYNGRARLVLPLWGIASKRTWSPTASGVAMT